jgi:hypothetical protein
LVSGPDDSDDPRATNGLDGPAGLDDVDAAPDTGSLAELLDDLATEFPDVDRRDGPDGIEYAVGRQPFARLSASRAEFRLRAEIVAAAVRTGDAGPSPSGREWVAFAPRAFDQYALDRAQAWFELGHRLAAEAARRH